MSEGFGQAGFQVIPTRKIKRSVTVGTASVQLLRNNPNRLMARIISDGGNADSIYVDDTGGVTTAAYEEEIPIGEHLDLHRADQKEKWGISGTASQTVNVIEYIFQGGVPTYPRQ